MTKDYLLFNLRRGRKKNMGISLTKSSSFIMRLTFYSKEKSPTLPLLTRQQQQELAPATSTLARPVPGFTAE